MGAPRWVPTEADLEVIRTHNTVDAAKALGKDPQTIRKIRRERDIPNPGTAYQETRTDVPQEAPGGPESDVEAQEDEEFVWHLDVDLEATDPSELWDILKRKQAVQSKLDRERDEARVHIDTDKPVLVTFTSDWHIGAASCAMQQLEDDLNQVRDTPGFYLITGGDLVNNSIGISHMGMAFEEIAAARFQRMLMDWILQRVKQRVLAVVGGNHPGWSQKVDDMHPEEQLAHLLGVTYFGPWGMLHLTVGEVTYDLLVGHKYRMNSAFNRTHAAKRFSDAMGDADAVFLGDKHAPAQESTDVRRQERIFSQAGSYQLTSRFGRSLGFPNSRPQMPGIILAPDQKMLLPVKDSFRDGVHLLSSFRSDVKCPCRYCAGAARADTPPAPRRQPKSQTA